MTKQAVIFFVSPKQMILLGATEAKLPDSNRFIILTDDDKWEIQINEGISIPQLETIKLYNRICLVFDDSVSIPNTIQGVNRDIKKLLEPEVSFELYIIYHSGKKEYESIHKKPIDVIFSNNLKGYFSESEHPDSVYSKFLVKFLNDGFNEPSFNELIKQFPDLVLEAKLELLHLCLDLEDAKKATIQESLKEEFGESFAAFQDGLTEQNHFEKLTLLRDRFLSH